MSQMDLKTGDLDIDLQAVKLALKLKKFVSFLMNETTFEPREFQLQS